jgi:RNA polymerase sigma-70 factor (ECF subfamily)
MTTIDDDRLPALLARDLDAAFETLVRCHAGRLYAIAFRVAGDPGDAEEIVQDAFVRAYRAIAGYEAARVRDLRLRPWLATIVVNLARNRRRRLADRQPASPMSALSWDDARSPVPGTVRTDMEADHADRVAERDRWATLLIGIPERYRIPIVLRHVDEMTYDEMSDALGRPAGTLRAQVHRGLALLRAAWEAAEREEAIA